MKALTFNIQHSAKLMLMKSDWELNR